MRKSREEAAASHKRIVAAASEEFRKNGIGGTGLADLMAAAGMTQGGFYRHFNSKNQVVEHSLAAASTGLRDGIAEVIASAPKGKGLQYAVADYLSIDHRDDAVTGCPFVALGGELARGSHEVRAASTAGLMELIDLIAAQIEGLPSAATRKKALVIVATMIGALTMARIVPDPDQSANILRDVRKALAP